MLKIANARIKSSNNEISVGELSNKMTINSTDSIVNELLCPDCDCELSFVQKTESRIAYLRTKQTHKHDEDCQYRLEEAGKVGPKKVKIELVNVPDNIIQKRLKRLSQDIRKAQKSTANDDFNTKRKSSNKKSRTEKVDKNLPSEDVVISKPTFDNGVTNTKVPSIKHRDISEIKDETLLGQLMLVNGLVESIQVKRNRYNDPVMDMEVSSTITGGTFLVQSMPELFLSNVSSEGILKTFADNVNISQQKLLVVIATTPYKDGNKSVATLNRIEHIHVDKYDIVTFNHKVEEGKYNEVDVF